MKLDVDKAAEAAAVIKKITNTGIDETFKRAAEVMRKVEDNPISEKCMEAFGKDENDYNANYLPKYQENEKILLEDYPELVAAINKIEVGVTSKGNSDAKLEGFDPSGMTVV